MISVLLPTFNRAEYLAEAIDSVLNQSYKDFELIVQDDGSTDSTPVLMEYYTKKDPRVKYFYTKNQGIAKARNTALSHSTGEYIAVMDSDDLMGPDRLKRQFRELMKGADICYSSYLRADENATVIDGVKAPKPKDITMETLKLDQGIPHVTVTARRECFEKYPYDNKHVVNDDYALMVNFIKTGYKLSYIEDPLMIVRFHTQNTSRIAWEQIKVINEEVRATL